MKFDWVTHKLFWTTGRSGKVYAMDLDSTEQHIAQIARGDWTYALALHPCLGRVFWSDSGFKTGGGVYEPRIETASLSGARRSVLVNKDVSLVVSLTVDFQENFLYWADANRLRIERIDFNGNNRQVVTEGYRPKGLEIYGDYLFFSDPLSGALYRVDKLRGVSQETVVANIKSPSILKTVSVNQKFM